MEKGKKNKSSLEERKLWTDTRAGHFNLQLERMILYRAVGLQELALIYDSGMKSFPANLPQQPILYPVLDLEYARQTASSWNTQHKGYAGYVIQFKVQDEYIDKFETHTVGDSHYEELWIPGEEIEELNRHIVGHIKVVEAHFGKKFQGFIPENHSLQGKNAVEQFSVLTDFFLNRRLDFYLEIKRNHKAVFLNYPFWLTYASENPGRKERVLQAIREAWLASYPQTPLPLPPSQDEPAPTRSRFMIEDKEDDMVAGDLVHSPSSMETEDDDAFDMEESHLESPVDEEDEDVVPAQPMQVEPLSLVESDEEGIHPTEKTGAAVDPTVSAPRAVHSIGKEILPPERPDPRFVHGVELGSRGEYHAAIGELSRLVAERPDHVVAQASLGVAFHRVGEDDRALACYEAALKVDPIYAEAHYFRANILYRRGQMKEAIAAYTVAIGLKPELIDAHRSPAPQDRLTDYTSTPVEMPWIARSAHRILSLNKSLESIPRQAELLKERAAAYHRLRNYTQAIADYTSALALQPQDADALFRRGVAYEQLGQQSRAREEYRKALAVDPQLSALYIQRGIDYASMGNLRQSIDSLTDGIRLDPTNPDSYFNRGTAYFQLGNFQRAIADFSQAIRLSADDQDAYYWRAVSQEQAGRRQDAIADYRRFLALSKDARARKEVEQKLREWEAEGQQRPGDGIGVSTQEIEQASPDRSETPLDLREILAALGERALRSTWFGKDVKCYGPKAEQLYTYTAQDRPIPGRGLLAITSGIQKTVRGDFSAFDREAEMPWFFIRVWEGSGIYVETDDPKISKLIQDQFPWAEEVDGASPGYQGFFLPF
jgi:tetratricopeptide (TPR) repeat protein